MSIGNLSPWHSVWDRNATGKRVITEGRLPFRVTTSWGLQNPLTYLGAGGAKPSISTALPIAVSPIANAGALAMFALVPP